MARDKTPTCRNCTDPLCGEAGELPVIVNDTDDPTRAEFWCPQCFVWIRAAKEPTRWSARAIRAARCMRCSTVSFDGGLGKCGACNAKLGPLSLGPKDPAVLADRRVTPRAMSVGKA